MASNFKISFHQTNGTIYLDLSGDFDGSAACELIHALRTHYGKAAKFCIGTGGLTSIHPFGLGLFQKECGINNLSECLVFRGKHGAILAPEGRNPGGCLEVTC